MTELRVGHGYDIHRLVEGRPLVLGGVSLDHDRGLDGHSDADVVTHAVMDALLGAAGLADIGVHFPPSDSRFEGADSITLLRQVRAMLTEAGWTEVVNVDVTIMAERPRLSPHTSSMCRCLSQAIGIDSARVNVKATTMERLGAVGREEGIAAQAVCLIGHG
jgi:2-C-methyl-D-erythritol 2,4-cyclodiphosphate synthase